MKTKIPLYSEAESFHKNFYSDFNIRSYKDPSNVDLNRVEPHRHTYYEIIWIYKGSGKHMVDFNSYCFEGSCLFILHPGIVHKITKDILSEGYVIKFSESFFMNDIANPMLKYGLFDNIDVRPIFHLTENMVGLLNDLLEKMRQEYHNRTEVSREILVSYLRIFLLQVHKLRENSGGSSDMNSPRYLLLQEFKRLVERGFKEKRKLGFYADQLATSERNLNDITQTYLNKSATSIIHERLLLEGKRLLFATQVPIKEIAYSLGFEDHAYFSRFFKKHSGKSPSNFRINQ